MTLRLGNFYIKTASQRHRTKQNGDLHTILTHILGDTAVCVYIYRHTFIVQYKWESLHSTVQLQFYTVSQTPVPVCSHTACMLSTTTPPLWPFPPSKSHLHSICWHPRSSLHLTLTLTLKSLTTLNTVYIEDTISQRKTAALSQLRLSLRGGGSDGVTVS